MKRTLERTTFMLIGALIASIAYFVGNADRGADAQLSDSDLSVLRRGARVFEGVTMFDTIFCDSIFVKGDGDEPAQITVTNKEGTGYISLSFKNGAPMFQLANHKAGGVLMTAEGEEKGTGIWVTGTEKAENKKDFGILLVAEPNNATIHINGSPLKIK